MRRRVAWAAAVCLVTVIAVPWIRAQQAPPVTAALVDEMLAVVRADMQASRTVVMAKNLPLTDVQAAKFWPVFDAYQTAQNAIMDEHLKGVQRYIEHVDTLDDAGALALMKASLERDAKMNALRQKALGDFQKVVGATLAVRAIQIDRRLSLAYQLQMVTKIPLVHGYLTATRGRTVLTP